MKTEEISAKEEMIAVDEKELDTAKREADVVSSGVYIHTFSRPFVFEGKTVGELYFDFDSLTAKDSLSIEAEMAAIGKAVIMPEISGEYLLRMAVRACTTLVEGRRLGVDAFECMPLSDYNRIRGRARSFLLHSGL